MQTRSIFSKDSLKSINLRIRNDLENEYSDIYTTEVVDALKILSVFSNEQKMLMKKRYGKRDQRFRDREKIKFLDPNDFIMGTRIRVRDAREGKFIGSEIPNDLQKQWIQGTGPATKPNSPVEISIRNIAYALLSGADGWMFDGEDALGQISTMSLANQRNLKLAIKRDPVFMNVAEKVSKEMNIWAKKFFGKETIDDWKKQLDFTTILFRARGLHLDDRHIRDEKGVALPASIVDLVLYVVNNYKELEKNGSSVVLYLPKIQTAEEAAFWNKMLITLEYHLSIPEGSIKVYVLVEQLEATFQLMEIRAALGKHFIGYNTGRWDYINSVSDALSWDPEFINPDIEWITMTYGYMRVYEDRVRRAVNTPDLNNNYALWQGGMEANIPVGSKNGVSASMKKALEGAIREQQEGASGKWVAHWKMVNIIRPVWEKIGEDNQLGKKFQPLTYTEEDANGLKMLEPATLSVRGVRNLISVALQYGNAFGQGLQAAALKPADFFNNDDILYLMEDAATGEIRLSILWEWIHKGAAFNKDDEDTGVKVGDIVTANFFEQLLEEEYDKLLKAEDKDVYDHSKQTTLPIAKEIVKTYVTDSVKTPWYIDLLNINLNNHDLTTAKTRIKLYMDTFKKDRTRVTENLDFSQNIPTDNILTNEIDSFDMEVQNIKEYFDNPRFIGIRRLYSAVQVAQQTGTLHNDYPIAKRYSVDFYDRLRELFSKGEGITSFGPYSPGQAVTMKRLGIEGIYLGGWATSAKGSIQEDPGPDLASYPLSQVPDEAATLIRALLTADKNQKYSRSKMSDEERKTSPNVDFSPFIIADADTGHGGDAHVRNLIRRFAEVGVTGYHIEDQKPGAKKCGHQGGKVLVPVDEQIRRLNAARFQLDIMKVPGIIVARTDAEAATLLDGRGDERDHPFILGATNIDIPSYKNCYLAILKRFYYKGISDVKGFMLYKISDDDYNSVYEWFDNVGITKIIDENIIALKEGREKSITRTLDIISTKFIEIWENKAGLMTIAQAVANKMKFQIEEGRTLDKTVDEWLAFAKTASLQQAIETAIKMRIDFFWDCELSKTPEGYYQIKGGIEYAIAKSLAVTPYADLIWMETKTADLEEARKFAEAIHAIYPDKMLAYNLSPSFNWDTTGMTENEMRLFPKEIGKLGFVFNFITYGGHQIDGLAAEEFSTALIQDGMLALARLQRKLRLIDSPYRTPQSLVGGPRLDGSLTASSGRTATTKAMGKGSTQVQHLVETEVPPKLLEKWLNIWSNQYGIEGDLKVKLRPHIAGSELLELGIYKNDKDKVADVIFAIIHDRREHNIISVRDYNTVESLRKKRLMALMHIFLIHRYKCVDVHYVTPTEDNQKQTKGMQALGIYKEVNTEVGQIIVATVNKERISKLIKTDSNELKKFISKQKE